MFERNIPVSLMFTDCNGEVIEVDGIASCEWHPHDTSRLPEVVDAWFTEALVNGVFFSDGPLDSFALEHQDYYLSDLKWITQQALAVPNPAHKEV